MNPSDPAPSRPSTPERRHAIVDGFRIGCMIHAALSAGIIDQLAAQPLEPRDLAFNNSLDPEPVASMCRWLAHEEVLEEIAPNVFGLGPVGLTLTVPQGGEWVWLGMEAFAHIADTLASGGYSSRRAQDHRLFDYLGAHPHAETAYQATIAQMAPEANAAIARAYHLENQRVIELGGGHGGLLVEILRAHPATTGVLVDRPEALHGAADYLASQRLRDRVELVEGGFFGQVPGGGQIYIIKWCIPDWTDDEVVQLLENCRASMPTDAEMHIIEVPAGAGVEPMASIIDLNVRMLADGKVRTPAQICDLMSRAGFTSTRVTQTDSDFIIVVGTTT